jgi:nitrogen regulatory protein P-II 1
MRPINEPRGGDSRRRRGFFVDASADSRTIEQSQGVFLPAGGPACCRDDVGRGAGTIGTLMKLIIALIQPTKLEAVKEALSHVEVFRLTVMDVQGFGRQKGYTEVYRGHEFTVNLLRKIELQIAVNEDFVEPTVNAIIQAGRSGPDGKIGDGKIFILPMDDCIRIRTGERGPEAI